MRHYEIMLLIHPDQSERARVMMDRYVGIIEGGEGQVHRNEDLGRRMLAYPIAKVQKAHYMLMNVECGQDTLDELVGALHFSDAVLRHLVVRRDEAVVEQSVLAKAAEKEAARENREFPYDREVAHERRAARGEAGDAKAEGTDAKAEAGASGDAKAADQTGPVEAAQEDAEASTAAAEEEQPGGEADASAGEAADATGDEAAADPVGDATDPPGENAATEDAADPGEEGTADDEAEPDGQADADEDEDPKEKKE